MTPGTRDKQGVTNVQTVCRGCAWALALAGRWAVTMDGHDDRTLSFVPTLAHLRERPVGSIAVSRCLLHHGFGQRHEHVCRSNFGKTGVGPGGTKEIVVEWQGQRSRRGAEKHIVSKCGEKNVKTKNTSSRQFACCFEHFQTSGSRGSRQETQHRRT